MSKYRKGMSRKRSKKDFKRGQRSKSVNTNQTSNNRGGMRF